MRLLRCEINRKRKAARLHVAFGNKLGIVYVRSADALSERQEQESFCSMVYESIHAYFPPKPQASFSDIWVRMSPATAVQMQGPGADASSKLIDLLRTQLAHVLQSLPSGTVCYLTVDDDPRDQGQASLNLRSDAYRQYLSELRPIVPDLDEFGYDRVRYMGIKCVDLSAIVRYEDFVVPASHVMTAYIAPEERTSSGPFLFKTAERQDYEGPVRDLKSVAKGEVLQRILLQEAEDWIQLGKHKNIIDPPEYFVTVKDQSGRLKLVGWLRKVYDDWDPQELRPDEKNGDFKTVCKLLGYFIDFVRGVEYMVSKNYVHRDLQWHNCLFDKSDDGVRLVISEFGRSTDSPDAYFNNTGPGSPESLGHWEASLDDSGRLVYSRQDPALGNRCLTMLKHWAAYPEALERMQVFTVASVGAKMLSYQSPYPEYWPCVTRKAEEDPDTKRWEALIPQDVKDLLHRCWSFDPAKRPLMRELLGLLEDIKCRLEAPQDQPAAAI